MSDASKEAKRQKRIVDKPLRVGGIDYLNALPLLHGLHGHGDPPLEVTNHPPSELASMLREGNLDIALVPVVAYAERADYFILPGIGISSYGPVRSIRLYHRRLLREARTVALDTSSRTSTLLTRLLYREVWGGEPRFEAVDPDVLRRWLRGEEPAPPDLDAALLIGDAALGGGLYEGWNDLDLGTEWTRWTGLPSVYAFWVCRTPGGPNSLPAGLVETFHAARDRGTARIDELVDSIRLPEGMELSECRHYLSHVIHYDLREDKLEALRFFFRKLREAGLLDIADEPLRFAASPVSAGV